MYRTPSRLVTLATLLSVLLICGCSSQLRKSSDTQGKYLKALRAEYLAANPEGEYNEYVKRGEVVKGMDFLTVLASWGHPSKRTTSAGMTTETWIYRDEDEDSKDWTEYTFTFRQNVLTEWEIARHVASGGTVQRQTSDEPLTKGSLRRGKRVP